MCASCDVQWGGLLCCAKLLAAEIVSVAGCHYHHLCVLGTRLCTPGIMHMIQLLCYASSLATNALQACNVA